ncbi:hypothetical protein [Leptospira kirschneri]|uniref:Uncharacterized protein n=1 Tax=Leptospira kirschneri serovar Bulgarica str. Nikolaevo TaxID=1240687 RepID=M6FBJ6_9LEPT|nr:hypothetical protein [Leptospira kirschneri]EMK24407.1 hypothetical protein LEP1GSC008_3925 [Leptospira kirschneri serovar Bulgarica str. Nikolaevo]EMN25101.1 hypothetical protein LEP1GSC065_2126 [Leptospira kirschneri serovar Sokoine str. RM1]EPG50419.1 hypothetical protein LEP1GSC049_3593 [Leptospira kirschneri serovar Cynopteri str. 3522 CT]
MRYLDLDHTVSQLDVLFRIVKLYSSTELEPLQKFSEENYVQQFTTGLKTTGLGRVNKELNSYIQF